MSPKTEVIELIQQLPEEKIPEAIVLLRQLIGKQQDGENSQDPLTAFMAVIVHSITNTMYDLSVDARRKEEKVMANRLEAYRKKVSAGWETYKCNKDI